MNLVSRAKKIILTPKTEWEVINQETTSTEQLYAEYIVPLAAIGPVAVFLERSIFRFGVPAGILFPIFPGLLNAAVSYVFSLVGVLILALLIDALAPTFGGQKNQLQALKIATFAHTPAWFAGVLHILPVSALPMPANLALPVILALLAMLYGLYLLDLGLPALMNVSKGKEIGYTRPIVVCTFVIFGVFGAINDMLAPVTIIR